MFFENEPLTISKFECAAVSEILRILPTGADLRLQRRSDSYITLLAGSKCDFCRIKASANVLWFSLDLVGAPDEIKADPRLQSIENTRLRHWKFYLSGMDEFSRFSDLILWSYNNGLSCEGSESFADSVPVSLDTVGSLVGKGSGTSSRPERGESLLDFPDNFTVIDLETTGYAPQYDEIIEISAIRVRDGQPVETFSSFVKPEMPVDEFITSLTGITNDMLATAPRPAEIFPAARDFIGADVVVGWNVSFDVNFLYDWFSRVLSVPFTNDFIDSLRIARKILPDLPHHRLDDVADHYGIHPEQRHRALADCQTTLDCFAHLRTEVTALGSIDEVLRSWQRPQYRPYRKIDLHTITTDKTDFNPDHPLYGRHCVFTGTLDRMTRSEAAQIVVDLGGICDNSVSKKTNFLILGNNDYCKSIKDGKSTKHKRAEELKLAGCDIEIIPENVFYDMIAEE